MPPAIASRVNLSPAIVERNVQPVQGKIARSQFASTLYMNRDSEFLWYFVARRGVQPMELPLIAARA